MPETVACLSKTLANRSGFSLVGELRNRIYELVATSTAMIFVNHNGKAYKPPLSPVCCQIRQEYKQIFRKEGSKYANTVNIHITNFVWNTENVNISKAVRSLLSHIDGVTRVHILKIHLSNTWDSNLKQLLALLDETRVDSIPTCSEVVFDWDRKTFDEQYRRNTIKDGILSMLTLSFDGTGNACSETDIGLGR